jgi:hypothetical protein
MLSRALGSFPSQCREIFVFSRFMFANLRFGFAKPQRRLGGWTPRREGRR